MYRSTPVASKLTEQRVKERRERIRRKRLGAVTALVDTKAPLRPQHMFANGKRKQQVAGACERAPQPLARQLTPPRLAEDGARIDHENSILLKHLSRIESKKSVDNVNTSLKYKRSLNIRVRREQLERITKDNFVRPLPAPAGARRLLTRANPAPASCAQAGALRAHLQPPRVPQGGEGAAAAAHFNLRVPRAR